MKKTFAITLMIFSLIFTSCKKGKKTAEKENSEIEFVILGTAKNGDGKKLGLHIPSLGMDNRLTSEIVNGKFEFKGTLQNPERAEIAFDNELEEFDGMYSVYDVYLTKDTLRINVTVDERDDNLYFSENSFEDNGVNTYYQKNKNKYWEAYNGLSYNPRDSIQMDSLRKYVFPKVRENVIKVNTEIFSDKKNTIIGLNNLKYIFDDRFVFDLNEMSNEQKKSINDYFNSIDKSYINSPDYTVVSSHIKRMNNKNFGKEFMDFSLPNIAKKETQLAEIISKNEFTVLDFWWSGCAPCRKFNQESKEHYKELKESGIEIVSINVDDGMKKWQRASVKDSIEWINLYAGTNSKIQADYNVVAFPTTIIFDKDKKRVDFEFHKATELLKLKSKK
ncbi:TlpA disulfide reductase family protein [Polaribacter sp. BM10]|uniref:TlpA disulfide reductase family protein n=1 Tax=Polaribacter sp. BM10 TaxID=1529069 RepID=UPI00098A114C|nr:TlpA disulfide reductase family protein [Polaribacter sp. BM10]